MIEIYISIILLVIFFFELYSSDLFHKEDKTIEHSLKNKNSIIIIGLNGFRQNRILLDDIELSPLYGMEKINDYMINIKDGFDINQPLIDVEDIFQEEKDIFVSNETNTEKKIILKSINSEINNNIFIERENISNKDCIEYGLSEDNQDYIICTKYE